MYLIDNIYFRYRRHKKDGNTKKQCGQKPREFNNDACTNVDVNTGKYILDKTLIAGNVVSFCHVA